METLEFTTVDKSGWPRGPWDAEPDKKQWRDDATGLPCLIVRAPFGALCGYVGISESHPWHGKCYMDCIHPDRHEDHEGDDWHYSCTPSGIIDVHGGLTFARSSADMGRAAWEDMQRSKASHEKESRKYPEGDSARWLKSWGAVIDDYAAWRERMEASTICHTPAPGEPDNVWWFGFDCAHSGDCTPGYVGYGEGIYREMSYVERQCADLAGQLFAHG